MKCKRRKGRELQQSIGWKWENISGIGERETDVASKIEEVT